jgi:hypothetical protein
MRKTVLATLIAVAFGLMGLLPAQAAPANGLAIGNAATGLGVLDQVCHRHRFRRRRRFRRFRRRRFRY